jgi:vitamin B12 transporter
MPAAHGAPVRQTGKNIMKILLASATSSCAVLLCAATFAQDDRVGVEAPSVEVNAFRVPLLERETTQGVTVISNREIEARNAATLAEILQTVPGVQVDQQGGPGGLSSIYIRGSDPEHVLVLIDGMRMNDLLLSRGGAYDLSAIDPATVERIEVIRGAGSAIYGADAIGGVVNIVTRRSREEGVQISGSAEAGTQYYRAANARVTGNTGRVQFSAGAATLEDGKPSDGGELKLSTVQGSLNFQATDEIAFSAFARANNRESAAFPDSSGGIRLAVNRTLEQRDADETLYGAGSTYKPSNQWGIDLRLSRYSRRENIDSPGVAPGPGAPFFGIPASLSDTELTRDAILASGSFKLPVNSDLTVGYERQNEEGDSRSVITGLGPANFRLERDTNSYFAALKSKPVENLVVLLDVRHDRISNLESETSPGAGVRYDFTRTGTAIKARYSEGFRPPSFYALASPLVGNPGLVSETSRSGELGVEQSIANASRLGASMFRTRTKSLIDFDPTVPGPIGFGQIVNRDRVETEGVEIYATLKPLDRLDIGANYTYVTTDILESAAELRNRPQHRASLSIAWQPKEASRLTWHTVYVGSFLDFSVPTEEIRLENYTRTDIGYSHKWHRLTAIAAVDNVFDQAYEEFVGFVNPGRRFRVGLSVNF